MATNKSSTEAIIKVEDQITCPICMEHFTDPRVLPCFHSYCFKCLQRVPIDNHSLSCPTCRSPCPVPDKGLASLPPSFVVNNLMEVYDVIKKASAHQHFSCDNCDSTKADRYCKQCAKFFCPECLLVHNKWKPHSDHQIFTLDEVASKAQQLQHAKQDLSKSCDDHNKPLDLFCESCQQLICHDCTVKKHEKPHHKYDLVTDTYRQRKEKIDQSCLHPLNKKYNHLIAAKKNLASKIDEIPQNAQATRDEILQKITEIKNRLDETGKQLTQKVDSFEKYKVDVLKEQLKEVDTAIGQVAECRDRVDQCVKVASPHQVLLTAKKIIKHTESVIDSIEDETFQPLEKPDIQLVKNPLIEDVIGEIEGLTLASTTNVTLHRGGNLIINQEATVTIALSREYTSSAGCVVEIPPGKIPLSLIKCNLTPPDNSPPIKCSIKKSSQSEQYNVVFTPLAEGRHELHVTVNGENTQGSPVSVSVSVQKRKIFW